LWFNAFNTDRANVVANIAIERWGKWTIPAIFKLYPLPSDGSMNQSGRSGALLFRGEKLRQLDVD
jgi:hypothetical protein